MHDVQVCHLIEQATMVIEGAHWAVCFGGILESGRIDIRYGHQVNTRFGGDHAKVMLCVTTTADDGDIETVGHSCSVGAVMRSGEAQETGITKTIFITQDSTFGEILGPSARDLLHRIMVSD
jgi:hypothetical protein